MINVAILAGGLGTRLAGVWDGPKCLVPIAGKPLLLRLMRRVRRLYGVREISLLLGTHNYNEVTFGLQRAEPVGWIGPKPIYYVAPPKGTAYALRLAPLNLEWPTLVLNGDTLPLYPLERLVNFYTFRRPEIAAAVHAGRYAGACVLGVDALVEIHKTDHSNLDTYLIEAEKFEVPGFIDVGTPGDFYRVQNLTGDDFDPDENPLPR